MMSTYLSNVVVLKDVDIAINRWVALKLVASARAVAGVLHRHVHHHRRVVISQVFHDTRSCRGKAALMHHLSRQYIAVNATR